ncbi:MAG: NAD-dependent epimerase/dehydratase family protein [Spirochaetaceae bacterium]|nr:MAG: NAD-dependent epimerase/dehydratase family protein [Spirochaetaceae bacterium]
MICVGVSGLTGMIGKNLINEYTRSPEFKKAFKLVAFTRRRSDTSFLERHGLEYRQIDYASSESFSGQLEDIDAFLHMAGLTKSVTPAGYYQVNVDGTARLLDALSRYGKKVEHFIFISSTSACGPAFSPDKPKTEEDPCNPVSHYGKSKLQAEELVRSCPFNWTIFRLPVVFGPYDYDILTMFRIIRSGMITMFSDPRDPYSYASAPDAGRFLLQALHDERLYRGIYVYCYDIPLSGRELIPMVRKALALPETYRYLKVPQWVVYPARFILVLKSRLTGRTTIVNPDKVVELAANYWVFSNSKLKKALGIGAIGNERAVVETVRWCREHQLL